MAKLSLAEEKQLLKLQKDQLDIQNRIERGVNIINATRERHVANEKEILKLSRKDQNQSW